MPNDGRSKLGSANLNRVLRIFKKVRRMFEEYEQKEGLNEAGGILLGDVAEDYVEITDVTVPNRFDLRTFFSFVRARIPAQLRINKAWKKSSGTQIYLGEWHTHREVNPSPSLDDREMIAKAFKETKMQRSIVLKSARGLGLGLNLYPELCLYFTKVCFCTATL